MLRHRPERCVYNEISASIRFIANPECALILVGPGSLSSYGQTSLNLIVQSAPCTITRDHPLRRPVTVFRANWAIGTLPCRVWLVMGGRGGGGGGGGRSSTVTMENEGAVGPGGH